MDINPGLFPKPPNNEENEANVPKMSGTFSLQGAGAFSIIVWVLYSFGISQGYINTAPIKTNPGSEEKAHIEAFLRSTRQINDIHNWGSSENRDGVPNWLLPSMNAATINKMNERLDRCINK